MFGKKYTWIKFAEPDADLSPFTDAIETVRVEGKDICITRHKGQWMGFANHCPHAGGLMADGYIDEKGYIVCPVHCYKFNLKNGRIPGAEDYRLKIYPVESRPDGLFVGLDERSRFAW